MAQILGSLSSYNSMANTCRMFKVLLKTIRISPQLVSYLKMGFSTKHWQKILIFFFLAKCHISTLFSISSLQLPNLTGRGSIWFWQCQHFNCFYRPKPLLPSDPSALVWLWRERQIQRLQDFTNPAAAQPRQKTQFDFARKTCITWLKQKNEIGTFLKPPKQNSSWICRALHNKLASKTTKQKISNPNICKSLQKYTSTTK